jgi:thiamine phosphate synthase YjbQ (UPF0047 family)|tara:strand:+ start:2215 stop:2457 length:243 start_codon:yes stop_codon:yes gene_type:complete
MTAEILEIVQTIPSISDRAKMLSHLACVHHELSGSSSEEKVVEDICAWIEKTWPHRERVRHHAAQQVAKRLRSGEFPGVP